MPIGRSNRASRTGKRKGSETPKSGKQRRLELQQRRKSEADLIAAAAKRAEADARAKLLVQNNRLLAQKKREGVLVNPANLKPDGSYSVPEFVANGFYSDKPFRCAKCGIDQVWTATQQKWWYEVAKGSVWTTASLCRPCRRLERDHRNEARRVHLEGLAKKKAARK